MPSDTRTLRHCRTAASATGSVHGEAGSSSFREGLMRSSPNSVLRHGCTAAHPPKTTHVPCGSIGADASSIGNPAVSLGPREKTYPGPPRCSKLRLKISRRAKTAGPPIEFLYPTGEGRTRCGELKTRMTLWSSTTLTDVTPGAPTRHTVVGAPFQIRPLSGGRPRPART